MLGTVYVITKKPVEAIDYISFALKNGDPVDTDFESSYQDVATQIKGKGKKKKKIEYPCIVLEQCRLDLGDIPFENQIGRIRGISEVQSFDYKNNQELLNKIEIVSILFKEGNKEVEITGNEVKYVE